MMRMAEGWGYRAHNTNPCKGTRRYQMKPMERYLSQKEMARLNAVLTRDEFYCPYFVAIVRLLMLTGCRVGEILSLEWNCIKGKRMFIPVSKCGSHSVWVSSAARAVIDAIPRYSDDCPYLFPGRLPTRPIDNIGFQWSRIRNEALAGRPATGKEGPAMPSVDLTAPCHLRRDAGGPGRSGGPGRVVRCREQGQTRGGQLHIRNPALNDVSSRGLGLLRARYQPLSRHQKESETPYRPVPRYGRAGAARARAQRTRYHRHQENDRCQGAARARAQRTRDAIRLLALTGCRLDEVLNMRWCDISEIEIKLTDTKTGPRTVPLGEAARALIDALSGPRDPDMFPFPKKRATSIAAQYSRLLANSLC